MNIGDVRYEFAQTCKKYLKGIIFGFILIIISFITLALNVIIGSTAGKEFFAGFMKTNGFIELMTKKQE